MANSSDKDQDEHILNFAPHPPLPNRLSLKEVAADEPPASSGEDPREGGPAADSSAERKSDGDPAKAVSEKRKFRSAPAGVASAEGTGDPGSAVAPVFGQGMPDGDSIAAVSVKGREDGDPAADISAQQTSDGDLAADVSAQSGAAGDAAPRGVRRESSAQYASNGSQMAPESRPGARAKEDSLQSLTRWTYVCLGLTVLTSILRWDDWPWPERLIILFQWAMYSWLLWRTLKLARHLINFVELPPLMAAVPPLAMGIMTAMIMGPYGGLRQLYFDVTVPYATFFEVATEWYVFATYVFFYFVIWQARWVYRLSKRCFNVNYAGKFRTDNSLLLFSSAVLALLCTLGWHIGPIWSFVLLTIMIHRLHQSARVWAQLDVERQAAVDIITRFNKLNPPADDEKKTKAGQIENKAAAFISASTTPKEAVASAFRPITPKEAPSAFRYALPLLGLVICLLLPLSIFPDIPKDTSWAQRGRLNLCGQEMLESKNYSKALAYFLSSIDVLKTTPSTDPRYTVRMSFSMTRVGDTYASSGDLAQASTWYTKAGHVCLDTYWKAEYFGSAALCCSRAGDPKQAEELAKEAIKAAETNPTKYRPYSKARMMSILASIYTRNGKFTEAVDTANESQKFASIFEHAGKQPADLDSAKATNGSPKQPRKVSEPSDDDSVIIGDAFMLQGDHDQAHNAYKPLSDVQFEGSSPKFAVYYRGRALADMTGDLTNDPEKHYSEALQYLQAAHAALDATDTSTQPLEHSIYSHSDLLNDEAAVYAAKEQKETALSKLKEALALDTTTGASSHGETLDTARDLFAIGKLKGKDGLAELKHSLAILQKLLGPDNPLTRAVLDAMRKSLVL